MPLAADVRDPVEAVTVGFQGAAGCEGFLANLRDAGPVPPDVENVFSTLMASSRDKHLFAFLTRPVTRAMAAHLQRRT